MWGSFSEELLEQFKQDYAERNQTQKDCGPGERVVFGRCSKGDNMGDKDIDEAQKKARAQGAKKVSNDKGPIMIKGRKMGWAIRDGKPVLVDYGSVAGEAKVGPKKPQQPSNRKGVRTPGLNRDSRDAYIRGQEQNANNSNLNASAQQAAQDNASRARGGA